MQQKYICLILHTSLENIQVTTDHLNLSRYCKICSLMPLNTASGTVITVKCRLESSVTTLQVINQGMEIHLKKPQFIYAIREVRQWSGWYRARAISQRSMRRLWAELLLCSEQGNTVFTLTLPVYR